MPIGLNIFVDKIFVIHLHLTKITKFIDLENLELYGIANSIASMIESFIEQKNNNCHCKITYC